MTTSLSVIIPVWNEAPLIADAVANAWRIADEVIVVDGGSPYETADIARDAGAKVVRAPKGRGSQLRAGADAAGGDIFLFLHADARLPASARDMILRALEDSHALGGGFFIRFLPESWFTRFVEPANDVRRRVTGHYYGDTGIFVLAETYRELGGFRPWPLMHDFEFSGRMERAGRCAYIRDPSIYASARRFRGREIRTLFLWLLIRFLYLVGVSPYTLAKAYADIRGERPDEFIAQAHRRVG